MVWSSGIQISHRKYNSTIVNDDDTDDDDDDDDDDLVFYVFFYNIALAVWQTAASSTTPD